MAWAVIAPVSQSCAACITYPSCVDMIRSYAFHGHPCQVVVPPRGPCEPHGINVPTALTDFVTVGVVVDAQVATRDGGAASTKYGLVSRAYWRLCGKKQALQPCGSWLVSSDQLSWCLSPQLSWCLTSCCIWRRCVQQCMLAGEQSGTCIAPLRSECERVSLFRYIHW